MSEVKESISRRSECWHGARDTLPLIVGAVPFGIVFGTLAVSSGLSPAVSMGLSLFVFAGASQFVAVGLVLQAAAMPVIVLTTFIVNLRHALYAASLAPYVAHLPQRWLLPLGFCLTDESYAVVIKRYQRADASPLKHWYYLGSALAMYANWQLCTAVGIWVGQHLQHIANWGLEFAMVASFIGIVLPMLTSYPLLACALASGTIALLLHDLPYQLGLVCAALAGVGTGYWVAIRVGRD